MQRILMAGHDEEVAAVGSRLAGYFEVFHNLMVKRLEEMLHASEERMPALAKELMVGLACLAFMMKHQQYRATLCTVC